MVVGFEAVSVSLSIFGSGLGMFVQISERSESFFRVFEERILLTSNGFLLLQFH